MSDETNYFFSALAAATASFAETSNGSAVIQTYNDEMVSVELEFRKGGTELFGCFICPNELGLLESGKRGWLAVSRHIQWRCEWSLRLNYPIMARKAVSRGLAALKSNS